MDAITDIFDALGGPTAIAKATGDPVQTVHSWKANKRIPVWRRASLLGLPPIDGSELSGDARAYLASTQRDPILPTPDAARAA